MGTFKKEKSRLARTGQKADGTKVKGENFYRNAKKLKTLHMREDAGAIRNKDGKIIKAAALQSKEVPKAVIQADRRWFNNTRVISQNTLASFRDAMAEQKKDPYKVLLRSNKIPMSLIEDNKDALPEDGIRKHRAKITVETEPFAEVFGPKSQRKRVKLSVPDIGALAGDSETSFDRYRERQQEIRLLSGQAGAAAVAGEEGDAPKEEHDYSIALAKEPIFNKGTSKRIWNELYKVIDSSDVVLMVLDARDPLGTRCRSVEKYMRTEAPHKHLIFVLNKIDLVPTKVAASWVKTLQKEHPTCALRSSIKNPFGRGSLIDLLRQFSILHKERKSISVGLIGYPNVGKSSIINCLRGKMVAKVAPIPGETKVWQYVALMKRIHLIDCPGIVPPNKEDTPEDLLLRGTVRVENVENPEQYIPSVLERVKAHHMERTYELGGWSDYHDFLHKLARKGGRLLRGGDPDVDSVAKMVLNDFMRGKIPWFMPPPATDDSEAVVEGREGRLGEMPRKRKRDDESIPATSVGDVTSVRDDEGAENQPNGEADADFGGFSSDEDDTRIGTDRGQEKKGVEEAEGDEDMIPLDASSDEEDHQQDDDESGVDEDEVEGSFSEGSQSDDDELDIDTGDFDESDQSEEEEPVKAPKKQKRTR